MNSSTENQITIRNCYQASIRARSQVQNFDVNLVFADYAPKYTETGTDGSVKTLQQVRSELEQFRKKAHNWSTTRSVEQFDMRGEQATVVLFLRDEVLVEYPSDVMGKLKLVPIEVNQVCKDTWLQIEQNWKCVRSVDLHFVRTVEEPKYVSPNSAVQQPLDFDEEVLRAMTLGMAYGNGVNLTRAAW
jgi:hypothetical protein